MTTTDITPIPVPADPPPGFWQREASHAPRPGSPLSHELELQSEWVRRMCAELGFLVDTVEFRYIGGWRYSRVVPLVDRPGPPPPTWMLPVLYRVVGPLRRRIAVATAAGRSDVPATLLARWYDELSTTR